MSAIVPIDPDILALIHGSFGAGGELQPFVREIMLVECHIAGTSHVRIQEIEPGIGPESVLVLKREPGNPHDPLAILILDDTGRKLGYVPRSKNEVLARLMDAGKFLFARVLDKRWCDNWLKVDARIYLRDV